MFICILYVCCVLIVYIYLYIFQFLNILLKKNYSKHNVSRIMTILSSQNSLNIYIYIYIIALYCNTEGKESLIKI